MRSRVAAVLIVSVLLAAACDHARARSSAARLASARVGASGSATAAPHGSPSGSGAAPDAPAGLVAVGAGAAAPAASCATRATVAPPRTPLDFREAKQQLRALYDRGGEATTLYAGCPFRRWRVDFKRCCFSPRGRRGRELEWEHVVPAAVLGRRIDAWQHGDPRCVSKRGQPFRGRRCARRVSERFRHLEGDMHNLFPALGAINNARGKAAFGLIDGEERAFGRCDLEITADLIEPRPAARGDIARACLYMDGAYPDLDLLDEPARRLLTGWSQADPPDDWERRRNEHIALVQGNRNPWIR